MMKHFFTLDVLKAKILYKFLKKKCLLQTFLNNKKILDSSCRGKPIQYMGVYYSLFCLQGALERAFFFAETKEGQDFWIAIRNEYLEYLEKQITILEKEGFEILPF